MATPAAVFFQGMGAAGGGAGSAFKPASPGPIGGTTPGAGSFTTLNNSGVATNTNSTDATALGTGAMVLNAGGLSVNGQLRVGGTATFSSSVVAVGNINISGFGGLISSGTGTSTNSTSGQVSLYRVNGIVAPAGSLVLQTDKGQPSAIFSFYAGTSPAQVASFGPTSANIGTIGATYTGAIIAGVQTGLAAVVGQVGEIINGTNTTSYAPYTTTATYQAAANIVLTPGDWIIIATLTFNANGATTTAGTNTINALSTTINSAAGAVEGQTISYMPAGLFAGVQARQTDTIALRVNVATSTTYYLNTQSTWTLATQPTFVGSLTATRIR